MQPAGASSRSDLPPVHVLMFGAFGRSGVARTVVNLANYLVQHRPVELISLFRTHTDPHFPIDPRIRVTVLHDNRRSRSPWQRFLATRPTRLRPPPWEPKMNLLTDLLLARKLRSLPAGVLVTTRPSLHLAAARWAPRRLLVVGQDHAHFEARFRVRKQARVLKWAIPRLDGYAVLTRADAADYRRKLPDATTEIRFMPNALPWPVAQAPAPLDAKVIVTAGRLDAKKGHDRMIRAFVPVARRHPDWQLHIYGKGPEGRALRALVAELGLGDQVKLKGYTLDVRTAMAEASVYALSSFSEGFSMVLIEAMSVGLPLVAMDCPRGPREIVTDGCNGLLVPDGDEDAFGVALLRLIEDPELRRRLGAQALEDARGYEIDAVGRQWEQLFEDLATNRTAKRARRRVGRRAPDVRRPLRRPAAFTRGP